MPLPVSPRRTVGLALGAGSSKGWAHIGAIEVLEEAGIPIDCVAGCSVGAFVGAIYASGQLDSLKAFVLRMDGKRVFSYLDLIYPRSGWLDGGKVHELFSMHSAVRTFEELRPPLKVVATDLGTGEKVVIDSGDLVEALRASMSIPGVFPPHQERGKERWLVDGGLVDPVPVGVARAMGADIVIAVDLTARGTRFAARRDRTQPTQAQAGQMREFLARWASQFEGSEGAAASVAAWLRRRPTAAPRLLEVLESTAAIMQDRIRRVNLAVEPADVLVQPELADLKMFDYDQVARTIAEGGRCMREQLGVVRRLLGDGA